MNKVFYAKSVLCAVLVLNAANVYAELDLEALGKDLKAELEKTTAEADKAKATAEKTTAEADKAKATAEKTTAELMKTSNELFKLIAQGFEITNGTIQTGLDFLKEKKGDTSGLENDRKNLIAETEGKINDFLKEFPSDKQTALEVVQFVNKYHLNLSQSSMDKLTKAANSSAAVK